MAKQVKVEPGTFSGTWARPSGGDRGRSMRELQDRASFDCEPARRGGVLRALASVVFGRR